MAEAKMSSRVFLVSSLALGVLAMAAAFVYLENTAGQERGPKTTILVAARDLKENAVVDPAKDLTELEIPARLADLRARALAPEFKAAYKGQRLNRTVLAGTPVMVADLQAPAPAIELKGDSRAISIPVKGANAMSGLVSPGDYVKVLVTRPATAAAGRSAPSTNPADPAATPPPAYGRTQEWETVLVAPAAFRVLAVNDRTARARQPVTAADAYQSAGGATSQQTVTLEVTEPQAKTILEQTGAGQLPVTLLLCPPTSGGPS